MVNIFNKTTSSVENSRRQVNTAGSLLAMTGVSAFNIHTMYFNPEHICRQICMLAVMIYLSTWWTLAVWYRGFREVAVDDNVYSDIIVKKASRHDTAMVLAYDVIFEIGIAYLSFYSLLIHYAGSGSG
jgi:ABC-type molybdate transport system substrate-binding protein